MNEGLSTKDTKKLNKASALDQSDNPKDQDRARARRTEVDYKDLLRQINKRKKPMKPAVESFTIDKSAHKAAQKKQKMRNLAKGNTNPNEKAAAEKKAGGPKLIGERLGGKGYKSYTSLTGKKVSGDWEDSDRGAGNKATRRAGGKVKKKSPTYQAYVLNKEEVVSEGKTFDQWKKAAASALGRKKEERKAEKAMDAGARAKRKLQRKEYAAKVSGSEDNVPDEMRD